MNVKKLERALLPCEKRLRAQERVRRSLASSRWGAIHGSTALKKLLVRTDNGVY